MNFKRVIFFSAILCLSSAYSFGSFFDKNSEPEKNGDEPIFIYKVPQGIMGTYSRKEVEKWMSPVAWIATSVMLVNIPGIIMLLNFLSLPAPAPRVVVAGLIGILS